MLPDIRMDPEFINTVACTAALGNGDRGAGSIRRVWQLILVGVNNLLSRTQSAAKETDNKAKTDWYSLLDDPRRG
ncbi:MAG: hypothetical protein V7703_12015 [Hyphomicrobiales bacterium]